MARPRMGALWHLDVTPGVDAVFEEISASYRGAVTVTQDLTVFNVTHDAVTRSPGEGQRCRTTRARTFTDQPRTRS